MPESLGAVVFEVIQWAKGETAADGVAEALAAYERKHNRPATLLVCNSNDLSAVQAAACDTFGLPLNTQAVDSVVWTRTMVRPRHVWAGRL